MSNLDADISDKSHTWTDVFRELDQWDAVETFAARHTQALDTRSGFRRFCSPKIGHLLANDSGGFQIIHHVHQDGADEIDDDDEGDIWALVEQRLRLCLVPQGRTTNRRVSITSGPQWSTGLKSKTWR